MNSKTAYILFFFSTIFLCNCYSVLAQTVDTVKEGEGKPFRLKTPSKKPEMLILDSATYSNGSSTLTSKPKKKSDIDSTVTYSAKDTCVFELKTKKMRLSGNSKLLMKDQNLNAEFIELKFRDALLEAEGRRDSNNKIIGFPKFSEKGVEYVGEKIKYNFRSKKGTITMGETKLSEGFYYGAKIKRVSETEMFVKDGCYTTCDAPHPHFYFSSPTMKVLPQDRIFIDPIVFYVQDMPLFMIPLGIFFPAKTGRQSGIIIPAFSFSNQRGTVLKDFGLYLALSDYYDTKFTGDFYSKGGYLFTNHTQWRYQDILNGSISLKYGKTRFDPDKNYDVNYEFSLFQRHDLSPSERYDININFQSTNFSQNTSFNMFERFKQRASSRASFSKSFDNGMTASISFDREQDLLKKDYSQTLPNISLSLPNAYPLKSIAPISGPMSWLRDISFSYSLNASRSNSLATEIKQRPKTINDTTTIVDTNYVSTWRGSISHNPSLSISPKLGYFTITPSISFGARNYFRKLNRNIDKADSITYIDKTENGFYTEYYYNFGVSAMTRLYGIVKPKIFGINALRHTITPTISYNFYPDLSGDKYGMFSKYYDYKTGNYVKYSKYLLDGGGVSTIEQQSISYGINNNFEAKVREKESDTSDSNVNLLTWDINGNINLKADSLKCSNVSMSFRIPPIAGLNLNSSANFTLYDQVRVYDSSYQSFNYRTINRFLLESGKMPIRLTNLNLSLSTSFGSSGIQRQSRSEDEDYEEGRRRKDTSKSGQELGERFRQRIEYQEEKIDLFGDNSPGYSNISIPWNISFDLQYQYDLAMLDKKNETIILRSSMTLKLTPTWSFDISAQYNFVDKELLAPSVNIRKDFHCWELLVNWYPIGYNAGFYLRFGIKSPQLKDLQIEKRSSALY
ncbi:MAG: Organic solvent tolerance protein OstA [Ignavibacteria bacterium]|nr:Organic solvent tolerance protein OstA [Ignavibacteria bacterium]